VSAVVEKALLDTNVVLDYLLKRQPFAAAAFELFGRIDAGEVVGALGATTVTTIHYYLRKFAGAKVALDCIGALLERFKVAAVDGAVLRDAHVADFSDFEDAVLHAAAAFDGCSAIITRNAADFRKAKIPVYSPDEFLALLRARKSD